MKPLKLKLGQIYEVTWNDAYGMQSWKSLEDHRAAGAWTCLTVGYYIGKNKAGDLLFAGDSDTQGLVASVQGRPLKMITKVRHLK